MAKSALQLHSRDHYAQHQHNNQLSIIRSTHSRMLITWLWTVKSDSYMWPTLKLVVLPSFAQTTLRYPILVSDPTVLILAQNPNMS